MPYFKNSLNDLYWLAANESPTWIREPVEEISDQEAANIMATDEFKLKSFPPKKPESI